MASITSLTSTDSGADSLTTINGNFANLNTDKIETSVISTDGTLAGDSDTELPTEKAVKTYVDANGGGGTVFDTTQVFNGTAPTTYTDLDLSSVIGTNQKVVVLRILTASASQVRMRRNGESSDIYASSAGNGISAVYVNSSQISYAMVVTDTSGIIEWLSNSAITHTINVEAYW